METNNGYIQLKGILCKEDNSFINNFIEFINSENDDIKDEISQIIISSGYDLDGDIVIYKNFCFYVNYIFYLVECIGYNGSLS